METWSQLLSTLDGELRRAMEFLYTHLPQSDLDTYPAALFLQFADHALTMRRTLPWCAELPEELFDHYVLFPRVNDEDLSFHRQHFSEALLHRVHAMDTMEERILEVNRWCHENASYQSQDDRTASPWTVYANGSGRCGEESAFLVAALRSVGIAARQVYSPRWAHCDDNHAWVEALCNGQWRFLGACEPEPILDRGWFNTAASRAILVHSRIFGAGDHPLHGTPISRVDGISWFNQTDRYAKTAPLHLHVTRDGLPAAGAKLELQVLNEATYYTVATLIADSQGCAEISLGQGDLHVLATQNGLWAEANRVGDRMELELTPPQEQEAEWVTMDVLAPQDAVLRDVSLDAAGKARRTAELQRGAALREDRMAQFYTPRPEDGPRETLYRTARSNAAALRTFLEKDTDPLRQAMVETLTDKDLRDVNPAVLEEHLLHVAVNDGLPAEVYQAYVLSPRIELEPLTAWRGALAQALCPEERTAYRNNPASLWTELERRITTRDLGLVYTGERTGLVWPPLAAWTAGRCDDRSLRILYVAMLRSLGVAARLGQLDGMPEYWQNGCFHPVRPRAAATLTLTHAPETEPLYRQNWTLAVRTANGWKTLSLTDQGWQQGHRSLTVPAGYYRLITSVRLPNGNQFAAKKEFALRAGTERAESLLLRSFRLEDLLRRQEMPVLSAVTLDGQSVPDVSRINGRPTLLCWMEEGNEPTEHVLNELMAGQEALRQLEANVVFLVRSRDSLQQRTLAQVLGCWPEIQVLLDDWAFDLETVARHLACDPERPPLAVVCNGDGVAVYGISGYHVGSVELMTRIIAQLCAKV